MKLLADFFPIVLFFVTYKLAGIYMATAAAIAAGCVQVGYLWLKHRKVEAMHLITLAVIVVFGGLTLFLHNEVFIKWKPTVINWLFGLIFLVSPLFGGVTMIERLLGGKLTLPGRVWQRMNLGWAGFFLVLGTINLFVAYSFDTSTWVNFKLFGILGLTLGFVVLQSLYLSRHLAHTQAD